MEIDGACTLPSAERPTRVAEFETLFGQATGAEHRPGGLRLVFGVELAAKVADLAARESGCCSFFTFTMKITGEELSLDIAGPEDIVAALAAKVP
ncbi:hypothetical protein ACIBG8_21960 [Nonomuraea sp. NPDC050556]|uniref:hypothetical protein n=1 Tax=Nonomuraea sp. NPDC050556 TaxID=3364369 RepID=UPI0037875BB4